jgi:hypothetical protein
MKLNIVLIVLKKEEFKGALRVTFSTIFHNDPITFIIDTNSEENGLLDNIRHYMKKSHSKSEESGKYISN